MTFDQAHEKARLRSKRGFLMCVMVFDNGECGAYSYDFYDPQYDPAPVAIYDRGELTDLPQPSDWEGIDWDALTPAEKAAWYAQEGGYHEAGA